MNFLIRSSSIKDMLKVCEKLKEADIKRSDIENVLNHEDYKFEFQRYKNRISENEFIDYFLNIPELTEADLKNEDLKNHHRYYKDLIDRLSFYTEKLSELNEFTPDLFREQISISLRGLPDDFMLPDLNFIFTIGIGQSFGYVYNNGMHFDFLQLIEDNSIHDFCATISHEIHHVGMNAIHETINLNAVSLESLFYLYFSGEGLAVKYCNNAEGVLSKSIYDGPKNIGLDSFTWSYLNNDFYNTMAHFQETIYNIRNKRINSIEELERDFSEYWMNPYIEGQSRNEVPELKHSRLYSFGNEIWGIIHDCFGKNTVFDTIKNIDRFPNVFNNALEKLGHEEFRI